MRADGKRPTEAADRILIVKEGCWVESRLGIHRIKDECQVQAKPIIAANGDVCGFRFYYLVENAVTYDLENVVLSPS